MLSLTNIKQLSDDAVEKLQQKKAIVDQLFEERTQRRSGELTPVEKRKGLNNIVKLTGQLRQAGINARFEALNNDNNLYIDDVKVYPFNRTEKEDFTKVEFNHEEAQKPFEEMPIGERDKQTVLSNIFGDKQYLPKDIQKLLPNGFGQETIRKAQDDIREDAGKEQSLEARIYRDFLKDRKSVV